MQTFNSGSALFFNFDPDFRRTLTLVLLDDNFAAFGGAQGIEAELRDVSRGPWKLVIDHPL